MPSIFVVLIVGADKKIILRWSFIDISELNVIFTYGNLLEGIVAGKYEHCSINVRCKLYVFYES